MSLPKWLERSRPALYVLLIFLCGMVAGALATNLWMNWGAESRLARADAPRPHRRTVEKFRQELNLTPEQTQKLNEILDATRKAYQVHEQEIETIRQQGRARIRDLLNDEQKAKYAELLARLDAKRKRRP